MASGSKRVLTVFSLAAFFSDIGSDIVFSLWPLYVTQVLGANMAALGFIDGLGDSLVAISQVFSGYWSDRLRRRKVFVWVGYLFGGVARIGYAFSPSWYFLIPFKALDRSGKMRGAPRDALLSEASTRSKRGRNFGILRAMDNFGAVLGTIIAIFFVSKLGYHTLFLLAALPSFIAVFLVFFFIPQRKLLEAKLFKGLTLRDISKNMWLYIILNGFFSLAGFSYSFLLILAKNNGIKTLYIPVLYLLFTLTAAIFSVPFGKLSDSLGRKNVLFLSFTIWGAVLITLLSSHKISFIVLAFVLYGLHRASLDPVQTSFAAELSKKGFVASTLGTFQLVVGIVSLPSSFLAGILWDSFGAAFPLILSLFLTIFASTMLLFIQEKKTTTE